MRVHVRPRVLRLAGLEQYGGDDLVNLADELEERVVGQVFQRKLALQTKCARERLITAKIQKRRVRTPLCSSCAR